MDRVAESYDVFLSCPMASIKSDAQYGEVRNQALAILECLEKECRLRVYFAGRTIESKLDFDEPDFSIAKDLQALEVARYFLLYYPEKVVSSALVEAGVALAMRRKAVYFVRDRKHLPFMLQKIEGVFPVKICECKTLDRLLAVIRNHRTNLFEDWHGRHENPSAAPAERGEEHPGQLRLRLRGLAAASSLSADLLALDVLLDVDVPSALNKIRYITEKVLHELCVQGEVSWGQAEPTLERMLGPLVATGGVPKNIAIHVRTIQTNTSPGSHYQEAGLSDSHTAIALAALTELLEWYGRRV